MVFQLNEESKRSIIALVKELPAVEALLARWTETLQTDAARFREPAKTLEATSGALLYHVPNSSVNCRRSRRYSHAGANPSRPTTPASANRPKPWKPLVASSSTTSGTHRELQAIETQIARWAKTSRSTLPASANRLKPWKPPGTPSSPRPELIRELLKLAAIHPILDEAIG